MIRETEAQLQGKIIDLARLLRWRVAHFRPARTEQGWRTAVVADGAGFPDLVLVRERVVFAELKTQKGRTSKDQEAWLEALRSAGAEAYLWRPSDWNTIVDTLKERHAPADA